MAHHSIEETFKAIKPKGRKGIPNPPTIGVGVSSNNTDLGTSLSQAGQQISQLQAAYQQQASLIQANTQAIQGNTSAQSGHSALSAAGSAASGLLGGFGLLSPLISGIAGLFGGSSAPKPLPIYVPPAPVAISGMLNSAAPNATPASGSSAAAPQVTVNVNAMDSQSFMDRSTDIANAVREAMLNMHPINGVVASL
ncbi:MAG TPA: hypothetical protein VHY84_03440 [Bryobacteraceae bacterium]|jgi:hypothetical protein|nr:hypothetical protein [Bryobacteraceae bacterium]